LPRNYRRPATERVRRLDGEIKVFRAIGIDGFFTDQHRRVPARDAFLARPQVSRRFFMTIAASHGR